MFCLLGNVTTAAPETSERKRRTMLEQIASSERDQSVLGRPSPPTVGRWRSLAVLRPDLIAEWHPTRKRRARSLQDRAAHASPGVVALQRVLPRMAGLTE